MYIAYSALFPVTTGARQPKTAITEIPDDELLLRYQAYQATCSKYHREIAAIQQFMPGWAPRFY